jgi:hypothetical protein
MYIIIIVLILIIFILFKYKNNNKNEDFATLAQTSVTEEQINNTANLFHNNEVVKQNLIITGNLTVNKNFNFMPRNSIVIWSGPSNQIPNGWLLCDGTNDTPDLRSRFIMGATNSTGQTGGAESITLTVNNLPPHQHNFNDLNAYGGGGCYHGGDDWDQYVQGGTTSSTGGGQAISLLPPYYALAYIMKS